MSQTLGELIRERRLGLGLSLGQLATKAATSAAVVRAWERDDAIPSGSAFGVLSELLGIEEARFPDPVDEAAPDLESIGEIEAEAVVDADADADADAEPESVASAVVMGTVPTPESAPVPAVDQLLIDYDGTELEPQVPEPESPPAPPEPSEAEVDPIRWEAALEPTPAPVATATAAAPVEVDIDPDAPHPVPLRYPASAPTGVAVEISETERSMWNPLRYLYDPNKPWLYWIRAGLTVVVLLILANILFDSIGELFDKIGEVFDSIEPADGVVEPGDTSIEG